MVVGYEGLSFNEKRYYDKIYRAIVNDDHTVLLPGLFKMDTLEKIVVGLKYDHAELFFVDFQKINCAIVPIGMVYYIEYFVSQSVRDKMNRNMENWIAGVLMQIQIKDSDKEADIYRKVHNYLIRNIQYDYEALYNPDAYPDSFTVKGIFERKRAVCEGISKAFKLLCKRAGAENVYIIEGTSFYEEAGSPIPHAWNIVKADTLYSHIDVTGDLNSSGISRYNRYDYFMISDEWISEDHTFVSNIKCQTCSQSYFIRKNCLIKSDRELKKFIEQAIQKRVSVLYFKIVGTSDLPNNIDDRVQNMLQTIIYHGTGGVHSIEQVINQAQHIYFYKIKY